MNSSLFLQVLQENLYPHQFLVLLQFKEFLPEEFSGSEDPRFYISIWTIG
jgi:hypothetical protein